MNDRETMIVTIVKSLVLLQKSMFLYMNTDDKKLKNDIGLNFLDSVNEMEKILEVLEK